MTLNKIYHASYTLKTVIRNTDLIYAPAMTDRCRLYLKTENLQMTGSFKVRGSYYKISQLSEEDRQKGVVACSAGNHAQGVALAATKCGIPSLICLPDGAPISKVEATKRYGARVELVPGAYDDAYARATELRDTHGYTMIHPFDDEDVIAGQGTVALELLDQLPDMDAVVVPVGGGGLIAGIAYAVKQLKPTCRVYGVQAAGAASMVHALHVGRPEALPAVSTIADGIAVKRPGDTTFAMIREYVDDIVTVTDDEISTAILSLIEQQKLIAEGAGAVAVAAVLFDKLPLRDQKVACLVSGGNIDVTILNRVITRGLLKAGRSADITIALPDKPGQLSTVSRIVADLGGNVVAVYHNQSDLDMDISACLLRIVLETRDHAHVEQIEHALKKAGYDLIEN